VSVEIAFACAEIVVSVDADDGVEVTIRKRQFMGFGMDRD
jgi:hypothetical protein